MDCLLETIGAVHFGCFIQFHIDTRHCRKVQDGSPAQSLPDTGNDINRREPGSFLDKRNLLPAQGFDHGVDRACQRYHFLDHTGYDNHGNKVRQIGNGLHELLPLQISDFIQ